MKFSLEFNFGFFKIKTEEFKLKGFRKNKKVPSFSYFLDEGAELKAFEIRKMRKIQDYIN